MKYREELKHNLINLAADDLSFERLALDIFQFQYHHNTVYQDYVKGLSRDISKIDRIDKIPFLPIEFFKSQKVISEPMVPKLVFESSGTTGENTSQHFIADLALYEHLSRKTFEQFYGPLTDYHIFALLPSYIERNNSSLVYMVQNFIYNSYSNLGGFYLQNQQEMVHNMLKAAGDKRKILLLGVSFALLDMAEKQEISKKIKSISHKLTVMETGGMKGRRKELIREDLHKILTNAFGVTSIHSEYGMTELLSQGYSKGDSLFELPSTMKILLREINDPFTYLPHFSVGNKTTKIKSKSGGINVIDLANIDSCSFIETKDLGSFSDNYQSFRILGRFDDSDLRGCNLLVN